VGKALSVYLQQPSSQQAGFPQQATTDAACADNEIKSTAANANTSALSFIMISFEKCCMTDMRASYVFDVRNRKAERKEDVYLNAEIVFEIKDHRLVTETSSKFTVCRGE